MLTFISEPFISELLFCIIQHGDATVQEERNLIYMDPHQINQANVRDKPKETLDNIFFVSRQIPFQEYHPFAIQLRVSNMYLISLHFSNYIAYFKKVILLDVWTTSTGFSFISVWTEVRPSSLTL
jgi:hypothetical protein